MRRMRSGCCAVAIISQSGLRTAYRDRGCMSGLLAGTCSNLFCRGKRVAAQNTRGGMSAAAVKADAPSPARSADYCPFCASFSSMNGSVIIWDLETVPDLRGFATANGLAGKTDEEAREAIGDKFPKHIYHSIVCIGALVARREESHWAVEALGAPHVGERTEKELISAFVARSES
jgi:hypothetical protein